MKNLNLFIVWIIANVIGDGKSATFGSLIAVVDQKMSGGVNGKYAGRVKKVGKYLVTFNANYANAVNNQLAREGKDADFQAKQTWFSKFFDSNNGSVVAKNDLSKFYLSCIVNGYEKYGYLLDGRPASVRESLDIDANKEVSALPKNQGTEKPIIFRTFKPENIREITANGQTLKLG